MLRIAQRDLKAARAMLDGDAFEEPTWGNSRLRYEDDQEPLNLDRAAWNQLCADLLDHVGSLLP